MRARGQRAAVSEPQQRRPPPPRRSRPSVAPRAAAELHAALPLFDLAVGHGLPCSIQNCGDAVYRSTLDAKLRMEEARAPRQRA